MPEDPGELGLSEADVPVIDVQHIGTFLCPECNRTMHGGMDPNFDRYLIKCVNPDCKRGFIDYEPPKVTMLVNVVTKSKKGPPLVLTAPGRPKPIPDLWPDTFMGLEADIAYCEERERDRALHHTDQGVLVLADPATYQRAEGANAKLVPVDHPDALKP